MNVYFKKKNFVEKRIATFTDKMIKNHYQKRSIVLRTIISKKEQNYYVYPDFLEHFGHPWFLTSKTKSFLYNKMVILIFFSISFISRKLR